MILPSGQFALIRDKYLTHEGFLVLVVEQWRDAADHAANPATPRCAHDHLFQPYHRPETGSYESVPASHDLTPHILAAIDAAEHDGTIAVREHLRGAVDAYGLFAHPHFAALEVTPRE
jgi:hypothetical protein